MLGPVSVTGEDGRAVALPGVHVRSLVASLALEADGRTSTIDALADEIWGDRQPQNPRGALQTIVSRLRAAAGSELLRSEPSGYALTVEADDVDLLRARRLATDADALAAGDPVRLALIEQAIALWRGEAGADLGDAPIADALAAAASAVLGRLRTLSAHSLLALGRTAEAIAALEQLTGARPYDEAVAVELMTALDTAGRSQEALAAFATLRARLRDDLGASPGPEAVALNARLLRGDPATAPTRVRVGLRAAPNELLGRADDLSTVAAMLERARLVTILGAGGLGKTRLAQAVAEASDSPAVFVVALAGVRADADVPLAVAAAVGAGETVSGRLADTRTRPDLQARVVAVLSERPTLLVLDNCEQVIGGVARTAAELLESIPGLRVLTTSRTPLAIAGEAAHPLAPLASGDAHRAAAGPAVRLFLERARAARPGALLPLDVVERLCTRLDGLPLAIELAAARVRTMTPEQIEGRLEDRFALLSVGDRAAPERHRTLEAVIAWSWDLLDPAAREALATLSVLPGGFSAETAAAVLDEPTADDVLDRLVSQSLLIVSDAEPGGVRFRMLETVREFGLARLEAEGRLDSVWDAATGWARTFATARARHLADAPAYREIVAEYANLVAVLRRAMDREAAADVIVVFAVLSQSWFVRGGFEEIMAFGPAAFEATGRVDEAEVPVDALAVVLSIATFVFGFTEDARMARVLARLRLLRRRHPELDPTWAALAEVLSSSPDPDRLREGLALMRASDDPPRALVGQMMTAQLAENDGEASVAMEAAERAWALADQLGEGWLATLSASSASQLASQRARPAEAIEWLDRAREGALEFGADEELRQQAWIRGSNLVSLGRIDEARALFTELVAMDARTADGLELRSVGWFGLGEVERAEGRPEAAALQYERAVESFANSDQRASPWYLMALAGLISATSFDETLDPEIIRLRAARLRARTLAAGRMRPGSTDRPVLGSVLLGWSAWAIGRDDLRDRAVEALALAEVLGCRQDLPSLHLDEHLAHAAGIVGAEAVARARAEASALDRDARLAHALAALSAPV